MIFPRHSTSLVVNVCGAVRGVDKVPDDAKLMHKEMYYKKSVKLRFLLLFHNSGTQRRGPS